VKRPRLGGLSSIELELTGLSTLPFLAPWSSIMRPHGEPANTDRWPRNASHREGMGNWVNRADQFSPAGVYFS
jgi:hypothetical protein